MALAEADESTALGANVLYRQPRTPAIMPVGPRHRFKPRARLDTPDALQVITQRLLLDAPLLFDTDVLERASAAAIIGSTTGFDPVWRCRMNFEELGLVEIAMRLAPHEGHGFTLEGAGHERFLSLRVRDSAPVMRHCGDRRHLRLAAFPSRHRPIPARPRETRRGEAVRDSQACRVRARIPARGPCRRGARAYIQSAGKRARY